MISTLHLLLASLVGVQAVPADWESDFLHDTLHEFNQAYPEANVSNAQGHLQYEPARNRRVPPTLARQDTFDFEGVSDEIKDVFACYRGDEVNSYAQQSCAPSHTAITRQDETIQRQDHPHSAARHSSNSDFFAGVSGLIDQYQNYEAYHDGDEEVSSSLPQSSEAGMSLVYEPFDDLDLYDSFEQHYSQEEQGNVNVPSTMTEASHATANDNRKGRSTSTRGVAALQLHSKVRAPYSYPEKVYSYGYPDPLWHKKMVFPVAKSKAKATYEKYATKEGRRNRKFEDRCNLAAGRDLLYGTEEEKKRAAFWIQWGFSTTLRLPKLRKYMGEYEAWVLVNQVDEMIGGDMKRTLHGIESIMQPEMAKKLLSSVEHSREDEIDEIIKHLTRNRKGKTNGKGPEQT